LPVSDDEFVGLLIEDSPSDAFLFQDLILQSHPRMKLHHAEQLQDGLELLRDRAIELVLLDLSLPDAQGIETVSRTHAARPDAAIIVLTGLDDEAKAVQAMQEGAQDYLVKGQVDRTLLARAIRYARERKRTEAAAHRFTLERAARARAQEDERRARFLADASRALASSLDQDATLSAVAKLAVPAMADGCLIDLVTEEGVVRRVAAVSLDGRPPEPWLEDLLLLPALEEPLRGQSPGDVVLLTEISEEALRSFRLPGRWTQPAAPRAAGIFPLMVSGRLVGTMTFLAWFPERRQGHEALWALELSGQVALALAVASTRPDVGPGRHPSSVAAATPMKLAEESSLQGSFPGGERVLGESRLPEEGDTLGGSDGGRFRVKATIGAGSMGVVYEAKDLLLGRTVALKMMRLHSSGSPQRTAGLFLVEARAIARLNHENIIHLFDAGVWRGVPYLVIEHLQGGPLYQFLRREQFPPLRAVAVMCQVLNGLEHAHRHGIVHRDLKPSNVFLLSDGRIKILDFGLAQMALAMGSPPTAAGTPGYMAPEQWRCEQQDQRVDLWAAGVMLFEMLAGDRPFHADSNVELCKQVTADAEPPSLQRFAPSLPGEAERLLNKALQKQPERRFQTAAELRAALQELEPLLEA